MENLPALPRAPRPRRRTDVDDAVRAFRNRTRGKAKDRTIDQYEQRFRNSVEMYRKWLSHERDWLPSRSRAGAARTRSSAAPLAQSDPEAAGRVVTRSAEVENPGPPHLGMVTYPLPIRPGVKVTLILPEDLTISEARRIASFVSAIAFDRGADESGGVDDRPAGAFPAME